MRHAAVAIGGAAALASILLLTLVGRDDSTAPEAPQATAQLPASPFAAALPAITPPTHDQLAGAWKASDPPELVAERYRQSKDLRAFLDAALRTGGGAHIHFAERAVGVCNPVASRGLVGLEQHFLSQLGPGDPLRQQRIEAWHALYDPCQGFEGFDRPFTEIYRLKGTYDDPLSRAAALVRGTAEVVAPGALERRQQALPAVLDAGGPYVVMELRSLARRQDPLNAAAWNLAAADLGVDMALDELRLDECANNGVCGLKTQEDFYRLRWHDMAPVLARKREILDAIARRDWAALGF